MSTKTLTPKEHKKKRKEALLHCKKCGERLKKDRFGKYCPTRNCQWSLTGSGIPAYEL